MDLFDQITRTKIILPRRRPDLLTRPRLIELMYDLLDYRLVLITAPAGSGKTSLLIDLAHQIELPVCWYTIDSLDQDPQRFIAHFIASIAQRFTGFGRRSATALQNVVLDEAGLHQLVTTLVNEIYHKIPEYFVIIFDDFHNVNGNEVIQHFLNQFTQQMSENCRLVVSSRTLIDLPDLPLMLARAQAGGLSPQELAFQSNEIQWVALQNYHLTLSDIEAETLVSETEGWITGIMLSAQMKRQGVADPVRVARSSGIGLYDYLTQQVFDLQSAKVQNFLLRTSPLGEFNADLCEAVLGPNENWSALIDSAIQSNLFVLPVDDNEPWLRYHHLFQEFLQTRLDVEYPTEKKDILQRLAKVYANQGVWEKAYGVYQQLGDIVNLVGLIEQAGLDLIRTGRYTVLAGWIDALSVETVDKNSFLLSLRGYITLAGKLGEPKQGVLQLDRAEKLARTSGDQSQLARTLVWRAMVHYFLANYQEALVDAEEAILLAKQDTSLYIIEAESLRAQGSSRYELGDLSQAIVCLKDSLAICDAFRDSKTRAVLLVELGMVYETAGMYSLAESVYDKALQYWRDIGNVSAQASLLNNMGVLQYLKGAYEQAITLFEEALVYAQQSGNTRTEALTLTSIGDLYADLDAAEVASNTYSRARELAQIIDFRFLMFYLDLAQASLVLVNDDITLAKMLLNSAKESAKESGSSYQQNLYYLEAGYFALTLNDGATALDFLEDAVKYFRQGGQRIEEIRTSFLIARAHQILGQDQSAMESFEIALGLASNLENWHPSVIIGRKVKSLLTIAKSDLSGNKMANQLLKKVIRFEKNIPILQRRMRRKASVVPFAPPKLLIKALGGAEISLNGEILANTAWEAKVARDLFFCLLAHPEGLPKEAIGAIFWPDYSPTQLKLQFKSTIYRLRRAVGSEVVLHHSETDRYSFNWGLDYEYDVEMFFEKIAHLHKCRGSFEEKILLYEEVIILYRGEYLPDIEGDWVWSERIRLSQVYQDAILKLTTLYLEAQEYELALEQCQKVLTHDVCLEPAHRLAMKAHAGMGNRVGVIRQFERCRQILRAELDVSPSPQTEFLYHILTQKGNYTSL